MAEVQTIPEVIHLQEDLRGLLRGDVYFDDLTRSLYSTDAGIFRVQPQGVVQPKDEADVQALVQYASEHHISLIARGAGTGLAGESLGRGLIVDISRYFRSILEIGEDFVRVQPGVVYRTLTQELAKRGRRLAPDPSLQECTLGGMLANNASGSRVARHGYTRDAVMSLRMALSSGEIAHLSQHQLSTKESSTLLDVIVPRLITLLRSNAPLIQKHYPKTPFNRCGYLLHDLLKDERVDLARLVVGSEGSLGLITEATLSTIPLPGGQVSVLLSFERLEIGLRVVSHLRDPSIVSCDLLDRRLLALTRPDAHVPIPSSAEAVLLIEIEADSQGEAERHAEKMTQRLERSGHFPLHMQLAKTPLERERFQQFRSSILPSLYRTPGPTQAIPIIEDVAVPVASMWGYVDQLQKILQRYELTASFLIHALTGHVHARPFLDLRQPEQVERLQHLTEEVHRLALSFGGTVSGQHGTGIARTPWVSTQYGPLYRVMREVKELFDPHYLFNPGKIIATDTDNDLWTLRSETSITSEKPETPALNWEENWHSIEEEIRHCNGCGECRTESSQSRMCPLFRATAQEIATPRAKANLMRTLLAHSSEEVGLSSEESREIADLCVNCKMCASECPAKVDIPAMMLEAKAANVAEHGLNRADRFLARVEGLAQLGSTFSLIVNGLLNNRFFRWMMEKLFGISRYRRLPRFAFRNFLQLAKKQGWTRTPTSPSRSGKVRVACFVDVFATWNDPSIAEAAVRCLHHNGVEVYVPRGQKGSGMAALAAGDVETAREILQRNLRIFADLAREGYFILCIEPTSAVMFKQDSLKLLGESHPDASVVAEQTIEWTTLVWKLYQQGQLRTDFQPLPLSVGHHVPCHMKALSQQAYGPRLLALIPQLRVRTIDVSCSGMAGTFGLKTNSYQVSLNAGRPMLDELRRPGILFGSTECSTCRIQMEDGAEKRVLHPAQYMALAYGLMPELLQHLQQPMRNRVL